MLAAVLAVEALAAAAAALAAAVELLSTMPEFRNACAVACTEPPFCVIGISSLPVNGNTAAGSWLMRVSPEVAFCVVI